MPTRSRKRFTTDWASVRIDKPAFLGHARARRFSAGRSWCRYIDWSPFFLTWELKGKYPAIFDDPKVGEAAPQAVRRCQRLLDEIVDEKLLTRPRRVRLLAGGVGRRRHRRCTPTNRAQQRARPLPHAAAAVGAQRPERVSLAGRFHRPARQRPAATTSARSPSPPASAPTSWSAKFEAEHDDYNSILVKALADRLAEAFAEYLHQQARDDWGYGRDEKLSQRRTDRRKVPRHPPRARLSGLPRPHRKADAVRAARRRAGHRHHADRKLRHVPGRQRQRLVLRPSRRRATSPSTASRATRSKTTPAARA